METLVKTRLHLSAKQRACREACEQDNTLAALRDMTPAEVDAYIDANVTDLPSAREFLKRQARVILYLFSVVDIVDELDAKIKIEPNQIYDPNA